MRESMCDEREAETRSDSPTKTKLDEVTSLINEIGEQYNEKRLLYEIFIESLDEYKASDPLQPDEAQKTLEELIKNQKAMITKADLIIKTCKNIRKSEAGQNNIKEIYIHINNFSVIIDECEDCIKQLKEWHCTISEINWGNRTREEFRDKAGKFTDHNNMASFGENALTVFTNFCFTAGKEILEDY